jgi:hypothetical protein
MVDVIKRSDSIRQVLIHFDLSETGGNYQTVKRVAERNGIDLQKHKGQGWSKGRVARNAIPLDQILVEHSIVYKSSVLKERLVKAGLIKDECVFCGLGSIWNGQPIVLELDHINGKKRDNRLVNLRVLCPNCHSQTPTFRGRKAQVAQLARGA